ncbi:glycosyltransferase [Pseudomonas sp. Pseusp97]|uniref:glycosyltransferase n=1 Tax=Pseudomonas sp. Pseusp97 TaxID=3243065 RepID=UPI0039A4175F
MSHSFPCKAPGLLALTLLPLAAQAAPLAQVSPWHFPLRLAVALVIGLIGLYALRHLTMANNRLFVRQYQDYAHIVDADWPLLTVLVPAHNEEAVVGDCLAALLRADYPAERLRIVPVNDRSSDQTRFIIDALALRWPQRIQPLHRSGGMPGKAAALAEAMALVQGELVLIFDADYLPAPALLKKLVAPFFDPEVGCVMGRVVPVNRGTNLLTRLLDLERTGGYQVNQQARMNLALVPQYGGTVGGVRMRALREVGGWNVHSLTEDTDLTLRMARLGWTTAYVNDCECFEEVPETWPARVRQISRWAEGHNTVMVGHLAGLLRSPSLGWRRKLDGALLLGVYLMAPVLLLGWLCVALLYFFDPDPLGAGLMVLLTLVGYGTLGNFAAFYEIAVGAHLDGNAARLRLLPLNCLGFLVSLFAISGATARQLLRYLSGRRGQLHWMKTPRFRRPRP